MISLEASSLETEQNCLFCQYDNNYIAAYNFHQERLFGEAIHDPNIWFEYGCFSMRVRTSPPQFLHVEISVLMPMLLVCLRQTYTAI